jgi:hypothetical protein
MPKFSLPTVYKHDFYDVEPIFTTRKEQRKAESGD